MRSTLLSINEICSLEYSVNGHKNRFYVHKNLLTLSMFYVFPWSPKAIKKILNIIMHCGSVLELILAGHFQIQNFQLN